MSTVTIAGLVDVNLLISLETRVSLSLHAGKYCDMATCQGKGCCSLWWLSLFTSLSLFILTLLQKDVKI